MKKKIQQFHMHMTPQEHRRLAVEAFERNTSMGAIVRKALFLFYSSHNKEEKNE